MAIDFAYANHMQNLENSEEELATGNSWEGKKLVARQQRSEVGVEKYPEKTESPYNLTQTF